MDSVLLVIATESVVILLKFVETAFESVLRLLDFVESFKFRGY